MKFVGKVGAIMRKSSGIDNAVRRVGTRTLSAVRRIPWLYKIVHAAAERLAEHPSGAKFIRSVLEPQYLTRADYSRWLALYGHLDAAAHQAIAADLRRDLAWPLISVIMPVYSPDERSLSAAIASVRAQIYPNWELCVADDASPGEATWRLLERAAASDPRIKILRRKENGHISAASNSALALAKGAFVALMDQDDLLPEHALYEVACELLIHPDLDLIYGDEDKIDDAGRRFEPYFKTDWDPELLLGQNYVSHLAVYRRTRIEEVGGFRHGFEGAQDYDLTLRVSEVTTTDKIRHIPTILYHWRQSKTAGSYSNLATESCREASERAVREHLCRTGQCDANVERHPDTPTWLRVRRRVPVPAPLVSVIIPTRDRVDLLAKCVSGVLERTDYPALELIIADNDSAEPATHTYLHQIALDPRVRIISIPGEFNYSRINNRAVASARGEIVVLLNNDVTVTSDDWLNAMVAQAMRPQVGVVGAHLRYPDGRTQHGGVILGVGLEPRVAGHLYVGATAEDPGYFHHLKLARNLSAVTGACLALRKTVFVAVGGLEAENLAVAFNDVDLCLKVRALGLQIIWTPLAQMVHLESASRGSDLAAQHRDRFRSESEWMRTRWGMLLDNDPFYGPNFDHLTADYRLAFPPNRVSPWMREKKV